MSMPPPPPPGYESLDNLGGAPEPHPRGTLILVLGILSLFICGIVLGVVAFVMGSNALKEIDRNPTAYTNRRLVSAGRVCGAIGAALSVLLLVLAVTAG
jgi:hypothetical protein